MLKAIIENDGNTLVMGLPCKWSFMREQLASIGIDAAYKVRCVDEEENPIKVKVFGESEFENKLASFISPNDTISVVNAVMEIYQNLPYQNQLDAKEAVMSGKVSKLVEFSRHMVEQRLQDTTSRYFCPLIAEKYLKNEYGDLDDEPLEYDGRDLAAHEEQIRAGIKREEARDENNLAAYFDGSKSVAEKLKEIHFSTQNVSGTLYGCIRTELTKPFTEEEEIEFKDWLEGQCSDGFGEGLGQRPIHLEDGELYVSYWYGGPEYFLLNENEFDEHLGDQTMGGDLK